MNIIVDLYLMMKSRHLNCYARRHNMITLVHHHLTVLMVLNPDEADTDISYRSQEPIQ